MKASLVAVILGCLLIGTNSLFKGENVALTGRATQSSMLSGSAGYLGQAINAIDGNQDANVAHGSCAHTENDNPAWWRVDLIKAHRIHSIAVTGRHAVPERLNGAEILIGNSLSDNGNNNPRCGYISGMAAGGTQTFQCKGMIGRYVNIVIRGRHEYLTLCEVQVFGAPLRPVG